jgi:hypothetical protein
MASFGHQVPDLKANITNLIKKSLNDPDDEVRERALLFYKLLNDEDHQIDDFVFNDNEVDVIALEQHLLVI